MATKNAGSGKFAPTAISLERAEELMAELSRRLTVVSDQALDHLVVRGVLGTKARDGCCKPDGGTCCPNARRIASKAGPRTD
jgi:hypothetical protein